MAELSARTCHLAGTIKEGRRASIARMKPSASSGEISKSHLPPVRLMRICVMVRINLRISYNPAEHASAKITRFSKVVAHLMVQRNSNESEVSRSTLVTVSNGTTYLTTWKMVKHQEST